jgi:hypothetical protein
MGIQSKMETDSRSKHIDKLLDKALEDTFPASDPIALTFDGAVRERFELSAGSTIRDLAMSLLRKKRTRRDHC